MSVLLSSTSGPVDLHDSRQDKSYPTSATDNLSFVLSKSKFVSDVTIIITQAALSTPDNSAKLCADQSTDLLTCLLSHLAVFLGKLVLDWKTIHLCSGLLEVNHLAHVQRGAFKVSERKKQTCP